MAIIRKVFQTSTHCVETINEFRLVFFGLRLEQSTVPKPGWSYGGSSGTCHREHVTDFLFCLMIARLKTAFRWSHAVLFKILSKSISITNYKIHFKHVFQILLSVTLAN